MHETCKYSVIGGSGFIGTQLCQVLFEHGQEFEIIDIRPSRRFPDRTRIADIRDPVALDAALTGHRIINLAAVHRDDVRDVTEYDSTNVEGTRTLCALAARRGIDMILFTSTVAVYGFAPPETGEDGKLAPFNSYGKSKLEAETVLLDWHREDPTARHLVIVRPTVVFGEGNRGNVYNLLNQIARGRFVMVGNGENKKSMAYVGNVAAFLWHAARTASGKRIVNYVDKPDYSMNQLVGVVRKVLEGHDRTGFRIPYALGLSLGYMADAVAWITGRNLPVSSVRVKKFCATTSFSSAAHAQGDFVAPFTLDEGLARTLDAEFINPDLRREVFFTE